MGYHNYCMQLFAACMTFNDLVIKTFKISQSFQLFLNGFFRLGFVSSVT